MVRKLYLIENLVDVLIPNDKYETIALCVRLCVRLLFMCVQQKFCKQNETKQLNFKSNWVQINLPQRVLLSGPPLMLIVHVAQHLDNEFCQKSLRAVPVVLR